MTQEYINQIDLDLYNHSNCEELATQAVKGRHLKLLSSSVNAALQICLCEDQYQAWLPQPQLSYLQPTNQTYQPVSFTRSQIEAKIPEIIAFTEAAKAVPNQYLWGGTLPPHYDCSGLIQSAFASVGIWIPRDSYQQEAFVHKITQEELEDGDLIFFGKEKVDHVALYLGQGHYIHSSGAKEGRNGIAIDPLSPQGDQISQHYYRKLRSFGRVVQSFRQ